VYGLDREDVDWALNTFTALRNHESKEPGQGGYGEYRTKRLVLERYDAMSQAAFDHAGYVTPLDPPPADDRMRHPA
jgi:hypothetical protein